MLEIYTLSADIAEEGLPAIAKYLDELTQHPIDNLIWLEVADKPLVSFSIVYSEGFIFVKYRVVEKYRRAVYEQINDPVYKDNCVEMFIAFGDEPGYYNFEFNCLGTALVAYGADRHKREFIDSKVISSIKCHNMEQGGTNGQPFQWELTVQIPLSVFVHHPGQRLKGSAARANFYKCGDDLPEPHFLSWNNISSPQPDFHLPKFFGEIKFM